MNIGIVCYPTFGGSGVVATELGLELARMGNEVHFISYKTPTRLDKFQKNIYFHAVDLPNYPLFEFQLYSLALAGKIIDVIKYENIDVLHVHYAIPHAVSGYLSKEILKNTHNFKLVTTLHGTDITLIGLEPSFHPLVKFALENSDAISAVSGYLREKTIQHFDPGKNIEVIHNFVDTNLYKRTENPLLRNQFAPNGEKIIIHVSNFRPVKRVLDVVRIFAEVNAVHPSKLIMIGDGPDRSEAEKLCRELHLCKDVKFLGLQSCLHDILNLGDMFLLPSQSESFGLSALEAMSCGVPVVGSNIGGIPEVISHGETGYVAEFADVQRMAKYVIELFDSPKKWKIFSENARRIAVEKFDTKKIVPKYLNLYKG